MNVQTIQEEIAERRLRIEKLLVKKQDILRSTNGPGHTNLSYKMMDIYDEDIIHEREQIVILEGMLVHSKRYFC